MVYNVHDSDYSSIYTNKTKEMKKKKKKGQHMRKRKKLTHTQTETLTLKKGYKASCLLM